MSLDGSREPLSIDLRNASLRYGGLVLFDGLDLTLGGGHWTCLLGPSGVGKSTLLRLIMGLESRQPSDGQANGGQVDCSDGLALAGRAAFMAQNDLLFPWLSALDNVNLGARLRGRGAGGEQDTGRARALLGRVGLAENADHMPATLSGGMRQRVALARTLMEDRPVVLMDEPFSALDAITRVKLQDLAAELLAGRTVLLVTHDPLEALRLGHRIHVLSGRPALIGEALEPSAPPPREVGDPEVLEMQGRLLGQLAEAAP